MHKFNVETAQYKNDYKIFLTFDDGKSGIVDLKNFLFDQDCGIFTRLKDKTYFKNFVIDSHTITWGDDLTSTSLKKSLI